MRRMRFGKLIAATMSALIVGGPTHAQEFDCATAADGCGSIIGPECLIRLGAGALALDFGAAREASEPAVSAQGCAAKLDEYRSCISSVVERCSSGAPGSETLEAEEAAHQAFVAAKDSDTRRAFEIVADRYPDTLWGGLAAERAKNFSGRTKRAAVTAITPNRTGSRGNALRYRLEGNRLIYNDDGLDLVAEEYEHAAADEVKLIDVYDYDQNGYEDAGVAWRLGVGLGDTYFFHLNFGGGIFKRFRLPPDENGDMTLYSFSVDHFQKERVLRFDWVHGSDFYSLSKGEPERVYSGQRKAPLGDLIYTIEEVTDNFPIFQLDVDEDNAADKVECRMVKSGTALLCDVDIGGRFASIGICRDLVASTQLHNGVRVLVCDGLPRYFQGGHFVAKGD